MGPLLGRLLNLVKTRVSPRECDGRESPDVIPATPDFSGLPEPEQEAISEECNRRALSRGWVRWAVGGANMVGMATSLIVSRRYGGWTGLVVTGATAGLVLGWVQVQIMSRATLPHLRDEARRRGMCPNCGYDLRATRERCPECGWAST
jgi:hypothetical protein